MSSIAALNSYSQTAVNYTIIAQEISLASPTAKFTSDRANWELIRTLGELTGDGVVIEYDVSGSAGATVAFENIALANNTLTVTNPSSGHYIISGILDIIDYTCAEANITPGGGNSTNVDYQVTYSNDNNVDSSSVEVIVDYLGVV